MYELPENLAALSNEELQALIDQGLDALRALGVTADSDEETVAAGEQIVSALNAVRETVRSKAAEEERRVRAEALIEAQAATPEPDPEPEPEPEPEEPEGAVVPDEVIQPEPVAASGTSPARRAAANAAPPAVPAQRTQVASLVAASDVPGIPTGAPLDGLGAAANALLNRMRGLPTTRIGGPEGVRHRYGAAMIRKQGWRASTTTT